ncbi:MAG TPA: hypothetical protein VKB79_14960 [Bryobacteraceae bacterium]|nr:hypothetical protein [Bryobacteraceae bacterium]
MAIKARLGVLAWMERISRRFELGQITTLVTRKRAPCEYSAGCALGAVERAARPQRIEAAPL